MPSSRVISFCIDKDYEYEYTIPIRGAHGPTACPLPDDFRKVYYYEDCECPLYHKGIDCSCKGIRFCSECKKVQYVNKSFQVDNQRDLTALE